MLRRLLLLLTLCVDVGSQHLLHLLRHMASHVHTKHGSKSQSPPQTLPSTSPRATTAENTISSTENLLDNLESRNVGVDSYGAPDTAKSDAPTAEERIASRRAARQAARARQADREKQEAATATETGQRTPRKDNSQAEAQARQVARQSSRHAARQHQGNRGIFRHHGKLSTLSERWGTGRALVLPPKCNHDEESSGLVTLTFTQRKLVNFWHFFMGEILPVVEYLAMHEGRYTSLTGETKQGPCLPRSLAVLGKAGPLRPMYNELFDSLGIELYYREMPKQERRAGANGKPQAERWEGRTLHLDSLVFQDPLRQCEEGAAARGSRRESVASVATKLLGNTSELWLVEASDCAAVQPRFFPPELPGGIKTGACDDFLRVADLEALAEGAEGRSSSGYYTLTRCAATDPAPAAAVHERFQFVRQWLLKWAGVRVCVQPQESLHLVHHVHSF
jgi:hypothetical protein